MSPRRPTAPGLRHLGRPTRLETTARRLAREALHGNAVATSRWRRLPDFLIIGAQKSGTTSLYRYLTRHPSVRPARTKEVHYFDRHFDRGERWYRAHFPFGSRDDSLTGEATPAYLFYPPAASRAKATVPGTKLIAVLRNPVERAYSHWNHERAKGFETLSLAEVLEQEESRLRPELEHLDRDPSYYSDALLHFSYLARGRYAEQVERWLEHFPRSQLLVLSSETLFADPSGATAEALRFLGLPPLADEHFEVHNAREYVSLDPGVRRKLAEYYRPHNARLSEMLDLGFDWD